MLDRGLFCSSMNALGRCRCPPLARDHVVLPCGGRSAAGPCTPNRLTRGPHDPARRTRTYTSPQDRNVIRLSQRDNAVLKPFATAEFSDRLTWTCAQAWCTAGCLRADLRMHNSPISPPYSSWLPSAALFLSEPPRLRHHQAAGIGTRPARGGAAWATTSPIPNWTRDNYCALFLPSQAMPGNRIRG